MQNIASTDAKQNFGELLDNAQHEPVTIEKHGRPVAVIMSSHEYEELKLARLREKLAIGEEQAERGEFADYSLEKVIAKLDKKVQ